MFPVKRVKNDAEIYWHEEINNYRTLAFHIFS